MKLPLSYYRQTDVLKISQDLLGKVLVTNIDGIRTEGTIVETEAYAGVNDKASHAYGDRKTNRTATMYEAGGMAYVYLCYGIHHLFNVVIHEAGVPQAVLIRGIIPYSGADKMLSRKKRVQKPLQLGIGPGNVSKALGIHTRHDRTDLTGNLIWIEDRDIQIASQHVRTGPRIGVDYAGEDAMLPYRFRIDEQYRAQLLVEGPSNITSGS